MLPRELGLEDLKTAIRHLKQVTDCRELVVGGRGALVAWAVSGSDELLRTVDFDIGITKEGQTLGVKDFDEKLGVKSEFGASTGFYIEHAGESLLTDRLPDGWRDRAAKVEVDGVVALCLSPVDLAINKLDANRPKDQEHLAVMIRCGVVSVASIRTAILRAPYTFLIPNYQKTLAEVEARQSNA